MDCCVSASHGHQFQDVPPKEFLHNENEVHDAMKMFNVYGHSYCGVAAFRFSRRM
jgi:hypothetical protein